MIGGAHDDIHVSIQKGIRSHFKGLFQAHDIIGVQKKVQISAAPVKAGDLRVTAEMKRIPVFDPYPG